jgi:type IV pilus assembly protein PilQ
MGLQTTVRITGSGELRYHVSRVDNPARLVFDFMDARLAVSRYSVPSAYVPVLDVRMGRPVRGQSRVVIDLDKFVPFNIQADGSELTVSFSSPAEAIIPASLHPVTKPVRRNLASAKAPEMPLPSWLTGKDLALARPVNGPAAPEGQIPSAAAQQAAAPPSPEKKYTGDPISVNLKDVDLKDFFRLIHEISGLNVVLDPAVRGTVTLVLDEVPWDQGLDIVLRNNGLTKEIDGNVLRIATQDTLKREADQQRELIKAQADAIPLVTITRVLSYAKADLVMTATLKRFLTARGDVYPDVRSNTLIIRDIPDSIPKIDDLLRQLDKKSQQVEIDARVVQATRSFAREIGTQLAYAAGPGHNVIGGGFAVGTSPVFRSFLPGVSTSPALIAGTPPVTSGTPVAVAMPLATNLAATAPTSGLTYAFTSPNFALDFMLSAMENKGVGKVLSEPKGVTQNNQKLTVKQGTKVPIQTNINNTIAIQFIDAVLKLEVTPQITADGTVFLDVTVENTQIDAGIPRILGTPALDTQSTETKVLINDGGTVVVGGVVVNNQTTNIDQVPLLGSLPMIGNLFKHTSVKVSSQELLFFVTPRIMPG